MASYPTVIDSFPGTATLGATLVADPTLDHALQHRLMGSALGSLEQVLGTTAGTNIHYKFLAGDLAVRMTDPGTNSWGTLQQPLVGSINNSVIDSGTFNTSMTGSAIDTDGTLAANLDTKLASQKAVRSFSLNHFLSRQALINAGFTINQRGYVSGAVLATGVYGHDRWKAGAGGGDYSFTQLPQSTQITIASNKTLIQVLEDKNVIGGTYTLSWTGTAQARFGINSATPSGAYAASPIVITTQTAGTVMSVEFNAGTLGQVQLNSGSVALPFMAKSFEEELRVCKRYYQIYQQPCLRGWTASTSLAARMAMVLPVEMRVAPTPVMGAIVIFDTITNTPAVSIATDYSTARVVEYDINTAAVLTVGRPACVAQNGTATLALSAEL